MTTIPRDAFGILSSKNTVSKYWGVALTKNKQNFTVRFHEKVNKEVITFKPKQQLPEVVAAQIAARFFDEPDLYSTSSIIDILLNEGRVTVNTCTNTIDFQANSDQPVEAPKEPLVEVVEEQAKPVKVKEPKSPKVQAEVDDFTKELRDIRQQVAKLNHRLAKLEKALKES